jgi:hypothetical protein
MPKTKESIAVYNKEYFARPGVSARAKLRNTQYRKRRAEYKRTEIGREAEARYRNGTRKTTAKLYRLKSRYNLTPEEVEAMKAAQCNLCAICNTEPKNWHIDHDHVTNEVRGLLCGPCNMALGLFKDSPEVLKQAVKYLDV